MVEQDIMHTWEQKVHLGLFDEQPAKIFVLYFLIWLGHKLLHKILAWPVKSDKYRSWFKNARLKKKREK